WGIDLQADGKLATITGSGSDMYLVRYDTGLLAASDSLSVTDTDSPPVPDAGGPYTVPEGGTVQLDASRTTDSAQDPSTLTYLWDFDGDGTFGETGADAARGDEVGISPVFSAAGLNGPSTYIVPLKVIDARRLSSLTKAIIHITNVNPSVEAGPDATINEGDTLSRIGSFTDPGPDSWTATVDYGDGSDLQPLALNPDGTFNLSHVYADNGS